MFTRKNVQQAFKRVSLQYPFIPGFCPWLANPCATAKDGVDFIVEGENVYLSNAEIDNMLDHIPRIQLSIKGRNDHQILVLDIPKWQLDRDYENWITEALLQLIKSKINDKSKF